MKLRELIAHMDRPVVTGEIDIEINSLEYDSRKVVSGGIFVALRGSKLDGNDFIHQAIKQGAVAIVAEIAPPDNCVTTWLHINNSRKALADLADVMNGSPSQHMLVAAVTGTNGKTTTAYLLHYLLNHAQLRCGMIGTVSYDTGAELKVATHTTPESLELQGLLAEMLTNGCRAVSMEASSHALDQHRMRGVKVDAAVFTNLTQDHLDYHGSMDKYFEAKSTLFESTAALKGGKLIINNDDSWGRRLLERYKDHAAVYSYGLGVSANYRAINPRYDLSGTSYELERKGRSLLVRSPLIGQFNVYNSLAALATAHAMGCNLRDTVRAMQDAPQIPGRMERVTERERFHIFVDYAHTPDGLINALSCARGLRPGRIITVFGCGGDRDRMKRPLMARAAEEGSDICILTSDNPRSEDPLQIMEDARKGFKYEAHTLIADRREAIHVAISHANDGDLVLIAGKGHETYQEIKGIRHSFDDRRVAKQQFTRVMEDRR